MSLPRTHLATFAGRRLALMVTGLALAGAARAGDIDYIDVFRNVGYLQTANGQVLSDNGSFFSITVATLGAFAYTSGGVSYGGPDSPQALVAEPGNMYGYQSPGLASKAAMDAAFPQGNYIVTLSGVGPSGAFVGAASLTLGADVYALSRPYLTGNSYSLLQGADAASTLNLSLSPYTVNPLAAESLIFFSLYDYDLAQFIRFDGPLPSTTTGITIPAGQLLAGHQYAYEVVYSSRIRTPSPGANADAQIGFESRTTGVFTTAAAVPEPGAVWLWLGGLGVFALRRRSLDRASGGQRPR